MYKSASKPSCTESKRLSEVEVEELHAGNWTISASTPGFEFESVSDTSGGRLSSCRSFADAVVAYPVAVPSFDAPTIFLK